MNNPNDMDRFPDYNQMPYPPFYRKPPRKKKWLACLLSMFVPGIGHLYLGLMQRGLLIMVLVILDIFAVVSLVGADGGGSIPLITLFSLIIPVIYFYNIFDALQSTNRINVRYERGELEVGENPGDPLTNLMRGNNLAVILVGAGALFFMVSMKPRWFEGIFEVVGSYVGALVLICAGLVLFLLESRKK
ncbi:DUF6677 family protein [Paenibacillus sp. IHBB 10380]|uniref:DUF6677 family protein n=1 Tax=Paenibacillus sp. IHBB 10380 TaxID=1566358 RepID=UPI0005CFCF91|nr:DUF6677 family protein [Paenibacillus sp. IHBB 10380]